MENVTDMKKISDNERISVWSDLEAECQLKEKEENSGIRITSAAFQFLKKEENSKGGTIRLEFFFPATDISGRWFPVCRFDRSVKADYDAAVESMTASSAPVVCFFNGNGENRYTIALSEVCQKIVIKCGIHEEDGTMSCVVEFPVIQMPCSCEYTVTIRESTERKPYWEVLDGVRCWWEDALKIIPADIPDIARRPMYSFWYSKHQNITAQNVEEESLLAAEMRFSAVIVDDGWQTEDNHRGYAFCGDWTPSAQ